jgi:hypothetical protein
MQVTDAEIEQERKSLEEAPKPLYVDAKADERSRAIMHTLVDGGIVPWDEDWGDLDEVMDTVFKYKPDGSIVRPFLTLADARAVQKPGQNIVIAGYATIGAARNCPDSVEHLL